MNKLLLLCFCIGIIGCATTPPVNKYADAYNGAVNAGHSVVIIKEGDLATMKDAVDHQLATVGYVNAVYSNPKDDFTVFSKDSGFGSVLLTSDAPGNAAAKEAHACKIFLKYTDAGQGTTRIDLVNGSSEPATRDETGNDIQKLADLIRNI